MTGQPDRRRRPSGWLAAQLQQVLARVADPLSASSLHRQISQQDPAIHASAVFRTLNRLLAAGVIDRIEIATGYVRRRPPGTIALCCSVCGRYAELPGAAPIDHLAATASARGFRPSRFVVEVAGLCAACATPDAGSPTAI